MLFSRFVFDFLDRLMYFNCNIFTKKGIKVEKNVTYNNTLKSSLADLYFKDKTDGKYPVLVNIHGGGFVAGNKKFRLRYCKDIADCGYFVMNINYGLCPESPFPEFIKECALSLSWLKDNAEKYNLDLNNVYIAGDSAGAYIAAYLGVLQSNPDLRKKLEIPELPIKIKGLLLYCGPYQVEELLTKKIMLNLQAEIGGAFLNIPKADVLNPEKINSNRYKELINIPPYINSEFPKSFITYAKYDFLCPDQGEPFIKLLQEKGVEVKYHFGSKRRDIHVYHLFWHSKSGREAMKMTREFLKSAIQP